MLIRYAAVSVEKHKGMGVKFNSLFVISLPESKEVHLHYIYAFVLIVFVKKCIVRRVKLMPLKTFNIN